MLSASRESGCNNRGCAYYATNPAGDRSRDSRRRAWSTSRLVVDEKEKIGSNLEPEAQEQGVYEGVDHLDTSTNDILRR